MASETLPLSSESSASFTAFTEDNVNEVEEYLSDVKLATTDNLAGSITDLKCWNDPKKDAKQVVENIEAIANIEPDDDIAAGENLVMAFVEKNYSSLQISAMTQNTTFRYYRILKDTGFDKLKLRESELLRILIYVAGIRNEEPYTLKELKIGNRKDKGILKKKTIIIKYLKECGKVIDESRVKPSKLVVRYCAQLHISDADIEKIRTAAELAECLALSYTPKPDTMAAAIVLMGVEGRNPVVTMRMVTGVSGRGQSSIKKLRKELRVHQNELFPAAAADPAADV